MNNKDHFGEVVESSLQLFITQCWEWDKTPSFGSLLVACAVSRITFGIVHQVQTGSMDPTRHPFAYRKTEEELMNEQPQIFEFLKTTVSSLTSGYQEKGHIVYVLAPEPPKIHAMVRAATPEESARFFSSDHYLALIFGASQHLFNVDELLLALFRYQATLSLLTQKRFEQNIATFSLLTGNDYRRLKLLVQRAQTFLP